MSTPLNANDPTLAALFSKLRTFSDIAGLLEVPPNTLRFYLHKANNYTVFALAKRSGGFRTISSPVSLLRIIQRKLNQVLHAVYGTRSPVLGFGGGSASPPKRCLCSSLGFILPPIEQIGSNAVTPTRL